MACMLQSLPCNVFQTEHELMHSIAFAVDVAAIYMGSGTYARRSRIPADKIPVDDKSPSVFSPLDLVPVTHLPVSVFL